ncbi:SH3 domain-containing protein [Mesobacillus jeotgali]|uniref:SH3 domain-containing protein n=1 Tax=Mesobacillus jeotgali TaxID=129985 RepID=UPI00177FE1CC|nr:SH3 domain-containing protein [Mesobacillus jeotgali]UYZ20886.1 SH3 domain-containing protein [Mesobacillus jeotgali]
MPRNKMVPIILCLMLIFGSLPALESAQADNGSVSITAASLNVRSGPGLSYPVTGSVKKGEKFSIVKEEGEWIQISLGGSKNGWVAEWFTAKESPKPAVSPAVSANSKGSGSVNVNGLRVRKGPGTNHQVIGSFNSGQAVEILGFNGNWAEVRTSKISGWVSKEYISVKESKASEAPATSTKTSGTVTATSLNVREKPSLNSSKVGQLSYGAAVTVHSQSNGWAEITYEGKSAWVSAEYVKIGGKPTADSSKPSPPADQFTGTVTASQLNIRDKNSLDGSVIGSVSKGQSFRILDEQNNWVQIEYEPGKTGWAAGWFFEKKKNGPATAPSQSIQNSSVSMLHNGTNIRKGPSTGTAVIYRANQGDSFEIISVEKDWYKIALPNGTSGFVAGWIVSVKGNAPQIERPGAEKHTKNKTIVIDPGHGGRDNGTTGVRGTLEKTLTLKTAQLLYDKLRAAGTNVILTRNNDQYISLGSRVSSSHYHNADAFISIHYDSINDRTVRGMTTYYYSSKQKPLGEQIHSAVVSKTMLKDRGTRFGDYHVIRENRQTAVLLELGYLSNPTEEMLVNTPQYQEAVANGIFEGLARYFKNN